MGAFFMDKRIKYSLKEKLSTVRSIYCRPEILFIGRKKNWQ
jgi:hypothetical protein